MDFDKIFHLADMNYKFVHPNIIYFRRMKRRNKMSFYTYTQNPSLYTDTDSEPEGETGVRTSVLNEKSCEIFSEYFLISASVL